MTLAALLAAFWGFDALMPTILEVVGVPLIAAVLSFLIVFVAAKIVLQLTVGFFIGIPLAIARPIFLPLWQMSERSFRWLFERMSR